MEAIAGAVADLDIAPSFDAAIMTGVLHHLPDDKAKHEVLAEIAKRLKPGSPFVVAGNYRAYASQPLFMAGWANRWRMNGAGPKRFRPK